MEVKNTVNIQHLNELDKALDPVLAFLMDYTFRYNLRCMLTSLIRCGDPGPHGDKRAVDFSVKGWSRYHIDQFEREITAKLGHLGAYSQSDGIQRIIVFHGEGNNFHGHLQVHGIEGYYYK